MKRIICLLTGILLLTGCSQAPKKQEKLRIVATVFPQYDLARQIAGDCADVQLLLAAGQEMHNYEPSPLDAASIAGCDIFLRIGGESEVWTDTLLDALNTSRMSVVTLMDAIEAPLKEEEHHHHGEHEHEEHEEEFDEHIWNSPVNAIAMAEAVRDALCAADPENAPFFRERAQTCIADFSRLDQDYRTLFESLDDPVLVIGDKFPFRYLAAEYGIHYAAAFSGCSSETEPTVHSMMELTEEVKIHGINTVFYLEFSSEKIAGRIGDMTGAQTAMLHPCHNISREDLAAGVTFLDLARENFESIKEALT